VQNTKERIRFRALLIESDDAYRVTITACMRLANCQVHDVATMALGLDSMKHNHYDIVVWGVPLAPPENRRGSIAEVKLHSEAPLVLLCVAIETAQQDLEAGVDQWLPNRSYRAPS
jgi:DNA-binding response OmpR family regulator